MKIYRSRFDCDCRRTGSCFRDGSFFEYKQPVMANKGIVDQLVAQEAFDRLVKLQNSLVKNEEAMGAAHKTGRESSKRME